MANNVKLLLVEDNPMVLGMLQQALSPLATVTSAPDGADALMKAVDDPPDLVVSDYRMPGMDGRQLVEKLKSRPATANFSAVLMASKSDIAERLSQQDVADDYLEKPFFLKDATRRIKRMIDRIALEKMAKTAPSDGVVRGNLAQMNVIDLMQSLEMGRKSCKLSLTYEGDRCEVFFVEGQVKHATYGDLVGDPEQAPVVGAVVELAHALGLNVIAEGVETEDQLEQIRALGCDGAQGYLFGRPVPEEEARSLLDGVAC